LRTLIRARHVLAPPGLEAADAKLVGGANSMWNSRRAAPST
jgi:hypothetical protein